MELEAEDFFGGFRGLIQKEEDGDRSAAADEDERDSTLLTSKLKSNSAVKLFSFLFFFI